MKNIVLLSFAFFVLIKSQGQPVTEKYLQNKTATYDDAISFYKQLDARYPNAKLLQYGNTDIGKPLHVFVITNDGDFIPESIRKKNKRILLINNGIHPGEPCGIDACISFSADVLADKNLKQLLQHVVIAIIPVYNIDGSLNRSCCSRANQNGPEEYGFRGNYQNLDLNRDFIKCDSENAKSFTKIFREWQPEIFLDTHISDGADYQYTMTLIATQQNKLNPILATCMNEKLLPDLYNKMRQKKWDMCPYVDTKGETPESGIVGFLEPPRFASGYAALFNTISFVSESHMLKPYPEQVKATRALIDVLLETVAANYEAIGIAKKLADNYCANEQQSFGLQWKLDTTQFDNIDFKGYEAAHKKSTITGLDRFYYDHSKPFTKKINFYNYYPASLTVTKPYCYIIPQSWHDAIDLLQLNKIKMERLKKDTIIAVESTYITDYKSPQKPYEGHYLHSKVEVRKELQNVTFYKGDYIIICNQSCNRYIVETLEPQAIDSYFAWNIFDACLQQKEWFSDYVFEEMAEKILKQNPSLKDSLASFVATNKLENKGWEQLAFIYKNSPYFEKSAMRYPVFRVNQK